MNKIRKFAIIITSIVLILSVMAGCTKPKTDPPVISEKDFVIESISVQNLVNYTGRVKYETAVEKEYSDQRVTVYGEKMFINLTFSADITTEPKSTSLNLKVDKKLDNLIKQANPDLELKTWVLDSNRLCVAITEPVDATEDKEYDIVIPKELTSLAGKTLKEAKTVKLKMEPHTFVKAITKSTVSPLYFDGVYNTYSTNVERGSNYYIYLQFNNDIDKDGVMEKAKEAFDKHNASYKWNSDQELKISLSNIRADLNEKVDLSRVLDADGNRIYTSPVLSILVGK